MGFPTETLGQGAPAEAGALKADAAITEAGWPKPRLLIVDDSSFVRYGLRRLLTQQGYEVIEAADGEAAVALYVSQRPTAVLLDITMPKMDGLEALRRIRRFDPMARVAMVTGMGQQAIVLEAIKSGASDFVVKPLDQPRVLTAIQKLVAT